MEDSSEVSGMSVSEKRRAVKELRVSIVWLELSEELIVNYCEAEVKLKFATEQ